MSDMEKISKDITLVHRGTEVHVELSKDKQAEIHEKTEEMLAKSVENFKRDHG